jgi:uncharacterized membrane protein
MFHGVFRGSSVSPGVTAMVVIIVIAAIAAIAVGVYFITIRKKAKEASGLSLSQKEVLENFDPQVLSLLTQNGGCLTQLEIRNHLGLPVELVAQRLLAMEKEHLIDRKWLTDEYTFCVRRN